MNAFHTSVHSSVILTLLLISLLVATLDAVAAIVVNGVSASIVFRYIAAGAFGTKQAFASGASMILYGLTFHVLISLGWTMFYFLIYPLLKLKNYPFFLLAIPYGILIWTCMNVVVVPLSKLPPIPLEWKGSILGMLIIMTMVALPITYFVKRLYSKINMKEKSVF